VIEEGKECPFCLGRKGREKKRPWCGRNSKVWDWPPRLMEKREGEEVSHVRPRGEKKRQGRADHRGGGVPPAYVRREEGKKRIAAPFKEKKGRHPADAGPSLLNNWKRGEGNDGLFLNDRKKKKKGGEKKGKAAWPFEKRAWPRPALMRRKKGRNRLRRKKKKKGGKEGKKHLQCPKK